MNLYQMEYFLAACRCKSINKASEQLCVSRPAVSKAIHDLEAEFGVSLVARSTTGISLTDTGHIFHERCLKLKKDMEELTAEMNGIRLASSQAGSHRLRLGLSPLAANALFPKYYPDFVAKHPGIIIEVQEVFDKHAVNMLEDNELDACLEIMVTGPPGNNIGYLTFGEMDLVFCCHKTHPLAGRKSVTPQELGEEPLACLKATQLHHLFTPDKWQPNIQYRTEQTSVLQQMVKSGLYSTVHFRAFLDQIEDTVAIPIEGPYSFPIWLAWNKTIKHNKAFDELIEYATAISRRIEGK